jgi:hypothetical protein
MILAIKIVALFFITYLTTCIVCELMIYAKKELMFRKLTPKKHLKWKDEK